MVIISNECYCNHLSQVKTSVTAALPLPPDPKPPSETTQYITTATSYDCSPECLDTGSRIRDPVIIAPRNLAPFVPPKNYQTENKETLWLTAANYSSPNKKFNSTRLDSFEKDVLNDAPNCGKCILYQIYQENSKTKESITNGPAIAMIIDNDPEGVEGDRYAIDQLVPGWEDEAAELNQNCPKSTNDEDYKYYGITISENNIGDPPEVKTTCDKIKDIRLKTGCNEFVNWTNKKYRGYASSATFKDIQCPPEFVDLVNKSVLGGQDEKSQKDIMDTWCNEGGGCSITQGIHNVGEGDNCRQISINECGEKAVCESTDGKTWNCPAICNASKVCPDLQVGDQVRFDCNNSQSNPSSFCSESESNHGSAVVPTPTPPTKLDLCKAVSIDNCGPDTPCTSLDNCPAICNAKTVCPEVQIGDKIKYDCSLKGTYCNPTPNS